ncbi:methyltransferase domain-containing protein [Marispirochaeta sp.]|uniref:class I SAM-dependent methyltransferase n=1 Tax=Marispirochaeta sp. TaxID=2038653 RepID=UPI0029C7F5E7|nr:methyltransferase domain-containing protein [Marispirochaeta sp.]
MKKIPIWYYDEATHSGVNYSDQNVVNEYDDQHTRFRDYQNEAIKIIQAVKITKEDTVLDLGCGSGEIAINVAEHCKKLVAVDISAKMIDLCKRKISHNNIHNVFPVCGGLLSYEHNSEPVDVVISNVVLHHLPDFWKLIALKNIYELLKPGGRFFLFDVVFSFPVEEHKENISKWLDVMEEKAGKHMMEESLVHVKEEYSTWDWILEKMLEKTGFKIVNTVGEIPNTRAYICLKEQ